jgi:hypothetical protein
MVILLFASPLIAVAALYALDLILPIELINTLSGSVVITAALSVLALAAILVAAYRRKDNPLLMSAWLFLFCGVVILSVAALIDPFMTNSESWTEELLSASSFFPLLFFAVLIASPVRLLILPRRRRIVYIAAGVVVLIGVCAVVFLPWLLTYEGPQLHASTKHLLRLVKPVLDTILAEPIALLVLVIGLASGGEPYIFIGFGLLLLIPEDVLDHFKLLREIDPQDMLSNLLSIASRLYLLCGALLGGFKR